MVSYLGNLKSNHKVNNPAIITTTAWFFDHINLHNKTSAVCVLETD